MYFKHPDLTGLILRPIFSPKPEDKFWVIPACGDLAATDIWEAVYKFSDLSTLPDHRVLIWWCVLRANSDTASKALDRGWRPSSAGIETKEFPCYYQGHWLVKPDNSVDTVAWSFVDLSEPPLPPMLRMLGRFSDPPRHRKLMRFVEGVSSSDTFFGHEVPAMCRRLKHGEGIDVLVVTSTSLSLTDHEEVVHS